MERVSGNQRLLRRNGVYYYRRRVPVHLAEIIGKAFVQFSLETTKLAEAKKRRAVHDLKWDRQFEIAEERLGVMARANPRSDPGRTGPPLSEAEVIRLVQEYVERMDGRARTDLLNDPPESEEQKAEIRTDIEIGIGIVRNRDDPRSHELTYATGRKILQAAGRSIEDQEVQYAAFAELVRRALLELDRRRLARIDDDHGQEFFDQLFSPADRSTLTFKGLAEQFLQLVEEEAGTNRTSPKWVDKQRANVTLLREIVGDDRSDQQQLHARDVIAAKLL